MSKPAKEVLTQLEIASLMQEGYRVDRVFSTGEVLLWKSGKPYSRTVDEIRGKLNRDGRASA